MIHTYFSSNFGCRVNEAEMQAIERQLHEADYTRSEANPDVYLINTCCVTQKAEREARQLIYQVKKNHPRTQIVITGCSATYWHKNKLYLDLPVDLVVNNADKNRLTKILLTSLHKPVSHRVGVQGLTNKYINSGRCLLKIQDGCQRFCAYCIVPYLRGKPKSERIKYLVSSIKHLENKAKEIILTAINTEAFGLDTKEKFVDLLKTIVDKTNVPRISLGSINPWSIDEEFVNFYKNYKDKCRLVDFFHIPIQSGCDKVLKLMKRGYAAEEILEKVQSITRLGSFAFLATDVIVGFLGETDRDFEETYSFLKNSPFSKFHVFRFSPRLGTAAWYMRKRLKEPSNYVKQQRAQKLIRLSQQKYRQFLKKHARHSFSGLVLEKNIEGCQEVLLSNQIPVYIPYSKKQTANIYQIKVIEYKKGRLFGEVV